MIGLGVLNSRMKDCFDIATLAWRVTDDRDLATFFLDWLFERYRKSLRSNGSAANAGGTTT